MPHNTRLLSIPPRSFSPCSSPSQRRDSSLNLIALDQLVVVNKADWDAFQEAGDGDEWGSSISESLTRALSISVAVTVSIRYIVIRLWASWFRAGIQTSIGRWGFASKTFAKNATTSAGSAGAGPEAISSTISSFPLAAERSKLWSKPEFPRMILGVVTV